jgi:hypothetical protein
VAKHKLSSDLEHFDLGVETANFHWFPLISIVLTIDFHDFPTANWRYYMKSGGIIRHGGQNYWFSWIFPIFFGGMIRDELSALPASQRFARGEVCGKVNLTYH